LTVIRFRDMPDSSPEDSVEEGHDPGSDSVGVPVVQFTVVTGAPLGLQVDHGMDVETGLHVAVVRGALEAAGHLVPAAGRR
jgi:hypothetical protein